MLLVASLATHGYSSESTHRELSNEYQYDRVNMFFKNLCVIVLWTKVVSVLEGLTDAQLFIRATPFV